MIHSRTGWSNLAIVALILTIASAQVAFAVPWWLRSIAVGTFAAMTIRCTIAAAHAPERRYTR